ncbi:MAG TPA: ABC transporter permease, partial [Acidimicrobiia bacterium]
MLRRLLVDHLRPYKRTLWLIVLLQTVQTTAALTLPTINASIIDNGVLHHVGVAPHIRIVPDQGYIYTWGGIMLVFAFIQIVFAIAAVYFGGKVAMSFGRDLRANLFHGVTDFSSREVGSFGAPSLITRITNDVQQVQMLVVMACTMAIAAPITMVVGVVLALRQDVGLSVVLVVAMPVAAIVLGVVVARMVPAYGLMQERIDTVNRVLREQITGIRVVRAFVREPQESKRFEKANADLTDVSLLTGRLQSSMFPTVNLLINVSSVAVLWLGANRVSSGAIEPGTLVAYLTYLVQILMSVVMATFMVSMIPRAAVSAERIQEVLDTDPSVVPPSERGRGVDAPGQLEFRDVAFHYPGAE